MKIKCITIVNRKGKGQTLTLEEARELYDSLSEIFGPKEYQLTQEPFKPFINPYPFPLEDNKRELRPGDISYSDKTVAGKHDECQLNCGEAGCTGVGEWIDRANIREESR